MIMCLKKTLKIKICNYLVMLNYRRSVSEQNVDDESQPENAKNLCVEASIGKSNQEACGVGDA